MYKISMKKNIYILTPLTVTDFHMKVTQTSNRFVTLKLFHFKLPGQGGIYVQSSYIPVVRDGRPLMLVFFAIYIILQYPYHINISFLHNTHQNL